jgi:flavin reductase (DIM6/NTAB) family NADH-FMN oxidoreductase RutF
MTNFTEISVTDLRSNPFQLIGREWMLITAGALESHNTMTASWGTLGHLWERDVAICYVRPQRHTYGFMERSGVYTLSFFDETWRKALEYCGSHSGRDVDKPAQTGLTPFSTPAGAVAFEQARLILECRKVYAGDIGEAGFADRSVMDHVYPKRDFHRFYVGEITRVLTR